MKKKSNWKIILAYLAAFLTVAGLVGGWMVTAAVTNDNKTVIKKVSEDVNTLENAMIKQTVIYESLQIANQAQQSYNADVAEILKNVKKK